MIAGLPYDAEVEYLESTGTQWIRTNIVPRIGDIFSVDTTVQLSSNVASDTWITGWYAGSSNSSLIGTYQSRFHFTYNTDGNKTSSGDGLYGKHRIRFNFPEGILIDDNVISSSVAANTPLTVVPWGIGGLFVFARSYGGSASGMIRAKIFSFIVRINGKVVFDGHPVRFTNELGQSEGAMYDRVSRKLFRNQGTWSFVIGPDVAVPVMGLHFMKRPGYTAKSYVRDGLVAMWDGIENAGWGVHDPNATTWKDLIGSSDLTTSDSSDKWEWTGDALWTRDCNFEKNITNTGYIGALRSTYTVEYAGTFMSLVPPKYLWGMTSWASGYVRYAGLGCTWGNYYSVYCNGAANGDGLTNTGVSLPVGSGGAVQSSIVYSMTDGFCDVYKDAVFVIRALSGNTSQPAQMIPAIIVGGIDNDRAASAKAHCIRLYNRALTSAEIAHNYAVDKERFNLP